MDYKQLLVGVAIAIGFISYASYFRGIFLGRTKPHVFSWIIWSIINGTAFFAQLAGGGGIGAWITGSSAVFCVIVVLLSVTRGEKNITKSDKISFVCALGGILGWVLTKNPLVAVILVCVTDYFAIFPTFRKSYYKPHEENAFSFGIDLIKFSIEIFTLSSFNLTTVLYPIAVLINDSILVGMILIRRKILSKNNLWTTSMKSR